MDGVVCVVYGVSGWGDGGRTRCLEGGLDCIFQGWGEHHPTWGEQGRHSKSGAVHRRYHSGGFDIEKVVSGVSRCAVFLSAATLTGGLCLDAGVTSCSEWYAVGACG